MSGALPCIVTSPMQRVLDMKRSADRSNNLQPAGKTGKIWADMTAQEHNLIHTSSFVHTNGHLKNWWNNWHIKNFQVVVIDLAS